MTTTRSPAGWAELAQFYLDTKRPSVAIACLNSARATTIGHKQRDRYKAWADDIAKEHSVTRHGLGYTDYHKKHHV